MAPISPDKIRAYQVLLDRDSEFHWKTGVAKNDRDGRPYIDESVYVIELPNALGAKVIDVIYQYLLATDTPNQTFHEKKTTTTIYVGEAIMGDIRNRLANAREQWTR